jgi:hypothetical protein
MTPAQHDSRSPSAHRNRLRPTWAAGTVFPGESDKGSVMVGRKSHVRVNELPMSVFWQPLNAPNKLTCR